MQLELKPANKLIYKLRLTPQMKLAISLLQMPLVKLQEYVKQQIEENPLLETEKMETPLRETESDLNSNSDEDEEKQDYRESLITNPVTLQEHLLRQLHLFANTEDERKTGEFIIENVNDDGYLKISIEEIAKVSQAAPSQVQKVLSLIQTFNPIGVGARDLRECLLLQIKIKGEEKFLAAGRQALVGQIVDKYLPYLEKKKFEFLANKLKVPVERIKEAIKEIANLEPKPGRSFNTERTVRLIPDAILKRNNDKYEVMLNDWELPSLNLNPKYKRMLEQKDITEDTKEYLKERLGAAKFLINAINNRKETIKKVTETIVYIQKDFLDNGMQNLKPMTLSQIAHLVDKHKSTVSRTVNNKYLQTPDGIFELRHFLSSGVKQENGEFYSSKAIKSKIKDLIENENKENPLTDQEVVNLLKQEGISISRRTIAKYRNQLKILSSKSRRE
ncbi:MAG: RNA polymerase factor sigma-54 [Candidatus Omnitrophica bacterium]|nr:RNA polymerase factor sigma-54 [Candidatus Omnitrophota bacterium]